MEEVKADEDNNDYNYHPNELEKGVTNTNLVDPLNTTDYFEDTLPDRPRNSTVIERYFSPIKEGSLRGSIISMASICFDTTCLSFPLALSNAGLIPGTIIFLLVILTSYITMKLLLLSGRKMKILNYRELVRKCLGDKMVHITDVNIVIFCIGVQAAYLVTINKLFMEVCQHFIRFDPNSKVLKSLQMSFCMFFLQIPLSLIKDMSRLQYASMAGTLVLLYTMVIILIESFFYYEKGRDEGRNILMFEWDWRILDTISLFLYGYATHNGMFLIYSEMKKPTLRRKMKVLNRAIVFQSIIFATVAYSGFFSLIPIMPTIFLSRPPLHNFDSNDYLILSSKILLVLSLHCLCSINFNMLRGTLKATFFNDKDMDKCQNLYVTFIVNFICNLLAFFANNVVDVIGIISGLCVTVLCYIFPILCYIKTNEHSGYGNEIKNISLAIFLIFITIIGLMCTIRATIENLS